MDQTPSEGKKTLDEMLRILEASGGLERIQNQQKAIEEMTEALKDAEVFSYVTEDTSLRAYLVIHQGKVKELPETSDCTD